VVEDSTGKVAFGYLRSVVPLASTVAGAAVMY